MPNEPFELFAELDELLDVLGVHFDSLSAFAIQHRSYRVAAGCGLTREGFVATAMGLKAYGGTAAAGRGFSALASRTVDSDAVPEEKLAQILTFLGATPEAIASTYPVPYQELHFVARVAGLGSWEANGRYAGETRTPTLPPLDEIAIAKEIVDDRSLFADWTQALYRKKNRRPKGLEPLVLATLRRAKYAFGGCPEGKLLDARNASLASWTDRIVLAFNRYQLAISAGLTFLDRLFADEKFTSGPIGRCFRFKPPEYDSLIR